MDITFTRSTPTNDPATGALTLATTTIDGTGIKVQPKRGEEAAFSSLGLTITNAIVLLTATPYTAAGKVKPGDTTVWDSETWTVVWVNEIAPSPPAIISRVGVSR